MTIPEVTPENNRQLQNIANTLAAAKKVIVFTGAGISTNCGIPVSSEPFIPLCCLSLITAVRTFGQKRDSTLSYKPNVTLFLIPQLRAMPDAIRPSRPLPPNQNRYGSRSPTMSKVKISSTANYGKIPSVPLSSILSSHLSARESTKKSKEPHLLIASSRPYATRGNWSDVTLRT